MSAPRFNFFAICCLALVLQACASAPAKIPPEVSEVSEASEASEVSEVSEVSEEKPVPELRLNLPDTAVDDCNCPPEDGADPTFLEKGLSALFAGDHREAVNYFRRYQRLESSPAQWEAEIAVAYDKMLPDSPFYNWRAATDSYRRLMREQPKGIELNASVLVMRESLERLVNLHLHIDDLQRQNDIVTENLEKREEALKRLRELTLGQ